MLDGRISTYQMEKRYVHKCGHIVRSVKPSRCSRMFMEGLGFYSSAQEFGHHPSANAWKRILGQEKKMEGIGAAGGVAHDFNNILAVIQLQSGLLRAAEQPISTSKWKWAADRRD